MNTEKWQMREEKNVEEEENLEKGKKERKLHLQVGKSCWSYSFAGWEGDGHGPCEGSAGAADCGC